MVAFRKMHGLGNDFIIIDNQNGDKELSPELIRRMAHRQFGIGCDQFIVLEPPQNEKSDVFMRIYNPDASESGACGNATRCVASLVGAALEKKEVTIQTLRGFLKCQNNNNGTYSVDMGRAMLDWQDIPLAEDKARTSFLIGQEEIDTALGSAFAVGMGNPHAVFFVEDAGAVPLEILGPIVEKAPVFPERTNVEIVSKKADGSLRMRVWERSAGITLACGSGACAVAVAAFELGYIKNRKIDIWLDGGKLTLEYLENGHVIMTGAVTSVFSGHFQDLID